MREGVWMMGLRSRDLVYIVCILSMLQQGGGDVHELGIAGNGGSWRKGMGNGYICLCLCVMGGWVAVNAGVYIFHKKCAWGCLLWAARVGDEYHLVVFDA